LQYADLKTLLEDQTALLNDSRFDGVVASLVPSERSSEVSDGLGEGRAQLRRPGRTDRRVAIERIGKSG
jgi:hypothetical protein